MEIIKSDKYLIKTKAGYMPFHGISKIQDNKSLKFIFDANKEVETTYSHRFLCGKNSSGKIFRQAKNIKIGQKIDGKVVIAILKVNEENDFFDILEVEGHTYTGNDVESHNCNVVYTDEAAYIKRNLWDDFIDAVIPTMNSLIFKQVINTSTANGMNHFFSMVEAAKQQTSEDLTLNMEEDEKLKVGGNGIEYSKTELLIEFAKVKNRRKKQAQIQWEHKDVN